MWWLKCVYVSKLCYLSFTRSFLLCWVFFFFASRRWQTSCALVIGVQTCALPSCRGRDGPMWVRLGPGAAAASRLVRRCVTETTERHDQAYRRCGTFGEGAQDGRRSLAEARRVVDREARCVFFRPDTVSEGRRGRREWVSKCK